jgi:phosphoglycerate dehydrogenase-like enzyme
MSSQPAPLPALRRPSSPLLLGWIAAGDRLRFLDGVMEQLEGMGYREWDPHNGAAGETLRQINPEVLLTGWETPPLDPVWLNSPECRLRYVCHLGGTVRRIVPRRFLERGGLVTNWGGAASFSVAEHAVLLALAALRDLGTWPQYASLSAGAPVPRTRTLRGKRVGIHGFGRIGQALAGLLRPFGVELSAFSAGVPPSLFAEQGVGAAVSLDEMLARSEVFFECEALTPVTAGCLTAARLALLPHDAVFVNVGRGQLVDEAALVACAREGRLRVAVDVMDKEPATKSSPFCQVPRVIASPHIGGPTREEYPGIGSIAVENLRCYRSGQPMEQVITLEAYDRST